MTLFPSATTTTTSRPVASVTIPDSKLAREVTELVKDTEPSLLFHHSSRVYYWGALTGKRRGLRFDPETPLCRRHVPRYGPHPSVCQPG